MSASLPNIIQVVGTVFIACFTFALEQLFICVRIACLLAYFLSLFFWSYYVQLIVCEIGYIS